MRCGGFFLSCKQDNWLAYCAGFWTVYWLVTFYQIIARRFNVLLEAYRSNWWQNFFFIVLQTKMLHVRYKWRGRAKEMVIKKLFSLTFKKPMLQQLLIFVCVIETHCMSTLRWNPWQFLLCRRAIYDLLWGKCVFSSIAYLHSKPCYLLFFCHTFSFVTVDKPFSYFRSALFSINECSWRHLNKKMDSIWHKPFELTEMSGNHLLVPY